MVAAPQNKDGYWTMPATGDEVTGVAADLGGQIKQLDAKIDWMAAHLGDQIEDLRVALSREMALQGQMLGQQIQELRDELAKQQVTTAWMMLGLTTLLGGLITVYEFLV